MDFNKELCALFAIVNATINRGDCYGGIIGGECIKLVKGDRTANNDSAALVFCHTKALCERAGVFGWRAVHLAVAVLCYKNKLTFHSFSLMFFYFHFKYHSVIKIEA